MKDVFLFNSKTRKKEKLSPIRKGSVSIYTCGPTLYQPPHIGNMRAYVFADTLKRVLNNLGYKTRYVINLTDVGHLVSDADEGEDKVEAQAKKEGKSASEIVEEMKNIFFSNLDKLNIDRSKYKFPKATEYIKQQIEMVKELEKKGYTYEIDDGIYFDTSKFKDYGVLGDIQKIQNESRIGENRKKRNNTDFALWKKTPEGIKRQQEWSSPWGKGFPGWHLECSAMSKALLGNIIDIHTGGIDHLTIHHNNEIAQSESIIGEEFVKIWMHSEFLNIKENKISKSVGNTITIDNLIEKGFSPEHFRYFLLQTHYSSPLIFTFQALESAKSGYDNLRKDISELKKGFFGKIEVKYKEKIDSFAADNLHTPKILSTIWDLMRDKSIKDKNKFKTVEYADKFLGLKLTKYKKEEIPSEIKALAKNREAVRKRGDFKLADEIRDQIENMGFELKDTEQGAEITKK